MTNKKFGIIKVEGFVESCIFSLFAPSPCGYIKHKNLRPAYKNSKPTHKGYKTKINRHC
nr:MAG TPA: hypothetical protein [Caudoviricetes sp.]